MTISRHQEPTCTVLALTGRLDSSHAPLVDREFDTAYDEGARKFIWDCAGLTYLSSAGLRCFLHALKKLKAGNGRLIVAGAPPLILDVFNISGFKSLMELAKDRQAALDTI